MTEDKDVEPATSPPVGSEGGEFPAWMVDDLRRAGLDVATAGSSGFRPVPHAQLPDAVRSDLPEGTRVYAIPIPDPRTGRTMVDRAGRPVEVFRLSAATGSGIGIASRYRMRPDAGASAFIPCLAHESFAAGGMVHVTNGVVESLCANMRGFPCIGLIGRPGWAAPGSGELLPELRHYVRPGRVWAFIWSSGLAVDPEFVDQGRHLARLLIAEGCAVRFHFLPDSPLYPERDAGLDEYVMGPPDEPVDPDELRCHPIADDMKQQVADLAAFMEETRQKSALETVLELRRQIERGSPLMSCEADVRAGTLPSMRDLQGRLFSRIRPNAIAPYFEEIVPLLQVIGMCHAELPPHMRGLIREGLLPLMARFGLQAPARVLDGFLEAALRKRRERSMACGPAASAHLDDRRRGLQLLADLRLLLEGYPSDRVPSAELLSRLASMAGRPWAELDAGRPMTPRRLAMLLEPFGIRPTDAKIGKRTKRVYLLRSFDQPFLLHLPPTVRCAPPDPVPTDGDRRPAPADTGPSLG